METTVIGYHFTNGYKLRDGAPLPPPGVTLDFGEKEIIICKSGYHASRTPWEALKYTPGNILSQVKCEDIVTEHSNDKFVCRRRTVIKTIDAEELMLSFARKQALSVTHLWNCPSVVLEYLKTGDVALRSAAESAARSAAESAAWGAAWSAARSAAESAAWGAARSAAESAAWRAAWSAAQSAARSAAESAGWGAARIAAESAAWGAAESAAKQMFNTTIEEAFQNTP